MARLPVVGSDDNAWGDILNTYLSVNHNADGTHSSVVASAGVIVDGSPSGTDGGELKFSNTGANKTSLISTVSTGTPRTAFEHRASSNSGDWQWLNGTNGGTLQMWLKTNGLLSLTGGLITSSGGITYAGSPNSYEDELAATTSSSGARVAITSRGTGNPFFFFDHLGTGNTGWWSWNNGTVGSVNRMILNNLGTLTITGGAKITGGINGYSNEIYFQGGPASITDNTANGSMHFYHLANSNTGDWSWANGTSGANTQASLSSGGLFKAYGGFDSGGFKVANVGFCTLSTDAATKGYVDTRSIDQFASAASFVNMATNRIINVGDPSGLQDAATRNYIDFMHTASKSANYSLTSNDQVIFANGTFTLTLLNASGNTGRWCYIVNTGSGTVTVGTGGGNINGASTLTMSTQYAGKKIFSDGTNWFAI